MSLPSSPSLSDLYDIDLHADEVLPEEQPQWYELKQSLLSVQHDFQRTADLITNAQKAQDAMDDALFLCTNLLRREINAMGPHDTRYVYYKSVLNRVNKARAHPYVRSPKPAHRPSE